MVTQTIRSKADLNLLKIVALRHQHVPLEMFSFLINMYEAQKLDYPEIRL